MDGSRVTKTLIAEGTLSFSRREMALLLCSTASGRWEVVPMNPEESRAQPGPAHRQMTVLESVEEIRAQIRGAVTVKDAAKVPAGTAAPIEDATPFRPTLRPSTGLLCVLDDGEDTGETLRIRTSSFVIGRAEGNLLIPHDSAISGRHAEINRRFENGEHRWYLRDMQSTNGTFVRASTIHLSHEQEFLIGGRRFRFEVPVIPPEPASTGSQPNATRKWQAIPGAQNPSAWHAARREHLPGTFRTALHLDRAGILDRPRPTPVHDSRR